MLQHILNKTVAFVCDTPLPNYLDNPSRYDYLEGNHSATGYYYWILKNFGFNNVFMVFPEERLTDYDLIVFHYDNRKAINTSEKYKTLQIVTDRPQVPNVDMYGCCNLSSFIPILNKKMIRSVGLGLKFHLSGNLTYIPYPMALNFKRCSPKWPPSVYHYTGRESTLIDNIASSVFVDHMRQQGVNLRFNFNDDHNMGDEDVYFCVRKKTNYYSTSSKGNNVDTKLGQKTANRLYQSWKMRTPFITSGSSAMAALYKTDYDFLLADTLDEFEYQCMRLLQNRDLFDKMVENCERRKDEHSNVLIVTSLLTAFEKLFA
jgi:hypothetical protein